MSSRANAPAVLKPQRRISRVLFWLFFVAVLFGLRELFSVSRASAHNRQRKQTIEQKVIGADRVLIQKGFTHPRDELGNAVELQSAETVAEVINLIEVNEEAPPLLPGFGGRIGTECMCFDDYQIEFRQGNIRLARFGLKPHDDLLVYDNPRSLGTPFKLTQRSYGSLLVWSQAKGAR